MSSFEELLTCPGKIYRLLLIERSRVTQSVTGSGRRLKKASKKVSEKDPREKEREPARENMRENPSIKRLGKDSTQL